MKKSYLIALASTALTVTSIQAQSVFEDFESYADTSELRAVWTGFGGALGGEIYLSPSGGTSGSQAAIYVGNWGNGGFFGAQYPQSGGDLSGSTGVTVDSRVVTNAFFNDPATETTEFRLGLEGTNGDVWESNVNQSITASTFTNFSFDLSETAMSKTVNTTGTETLADALASVVDVRFVFVNSGSGVQDIYLDNVSVIPEPTTFPVIAGLLAIGLVALRRRV